MKKTTLIVALLLLIAAGIQGYRQWAVAQEQRAALVKLLRPLALLRTDGLRPYDSLGRLAHLNIQAEPTGALKQWLGTPFGYRLKARELRVERLSLHPDQSLQELELALLDVRAPLVEAPTASTGPGASLLDAPLPQLSQLGYTELAFDARLRLRYDPTQKILRAELRAEGADTLLFQLRTELEAEAATLAQLDWGQAKLLILEASVAERGLFQRAKEWLALQARMGVDSYEQAFITELDERAERQKWQWSNSNATALRGFLRAPLSLTVSAQPLNGVLLDNVSLYAPGDRLTLFNAQLSSETP